MVATIALDAAHNNPDQDPAEIKAAEDALRDAIELQQKASKGKRDGAKNAGKYRPYEQNLSLVYSQ
jgi:hypothetical protein